MSFNTDIYIAFQLQSRSISQNDGWVLSGFNYSDSDVSTSSQTTNPDNDLATLPLNSSNAYPDAPPVRTAYSRARTWDVHVKREYAGINSSGGPQVAGRADHEDVVVTRDCDLISPYLFQYCASGWQIPTVYVIRYIGSENIAFNFCHEWVLTGVQVTDYQFSNGRYFNEYLNELTLYTRETVSLLYTAAKYRCSQFTASKTLDLSLGEFKGWDTGSNSGIGIPS